jgi:hypothetical protein
VQHDHLATAARAHNEALAAREQLKVAAARRDDAVRSAANAGHGAVEIAQALDVHRSRIYQMLGKKP